MHENPSREAAPARTLLLLFALTALAKIALVFALPYHYDESYYALYGKFLDTAHYDHPPMIGFFAWLLGGFGPESPKWLIRIFPAVTVHLVAALYLFKLDEFPGLRRAASLLLLNPFLMVPLFFPDAFLFFFVNASFVAYLLAQAEKRSAGRRNGLWLASGALLGLAFLSKHMAFVLGLVYLVDSAKRRDLRSLFLILLGSAPLVGWHFYESFFHCGFPVAFTLFTRKTKPQVSWTALIDFILSVALVLGPVTLWQLVGRTRSARKSLCGSPSVLTIAALLPLGFFALASLKTGFHTHWILPFLPFVLMELGCRNRIGALRPHTIMAAIFVATTLVLGLNLEGWLNHWKHADTLPLHLHPREFVDEVAKNLPDKDWVGVPLGTFSYEHSAQLEYLSGRKVFLFGKGKSWGRQYDRIDDFNSLDQGRIILVGPASEPARHWKEAESFFTRTSEKTFQFREKPFRVVFAEGFELNRYREQVLKPLNKRYYQHPLILGQGCFFTERYGLED